MVVELEALIIKTIRELDGLREIEFEEELNRETSLFGPYGILDSSGLVTLVIAIEQAIEDQYEVDITLADEKALSQQNSPYLTIGSLARYADKVIHEVS